MHLGQTPSAKSFAEQAKQLRSGCCKLESYEHGAALDGVQPQPGGTLVIPILTSLEQDVPVPAIAAKNWFAR